MKLDGLEGVWERRVLAGELTGIDPREEIERLRALVRAASLEDRDLRALFEALGAMDPIGLADLAVGPRAPAGLRLLEAALGQVEVLEGQVAPGALYRRLAVLAGPSAGAVLAVAVARHPSAGWLVALCEAVGERPPGLAQLMAAACLPAFEKLCWDHAAAGHLVALARAACALRRPEPVAALLAVRADALAAETLAALLEDAACPELAPWLAAVWGPDLDGLLLGQVHRLRDAGAAARLEALALGCPATLALLAQVRRALRV